MAYPTEVDAVQIPPTTGALGSTIPTHVGHHQQMRAAFAALRAELGSDPGGGTDLTTRLTSMGAMAIAGLVDVEDFAAKAGTLLNSADSLTGWSFFAASSAPALDTVNKTQGTASVTCDMSFKLGESSKFYYQFTTPQSIVGQTFVAFDVYQALSGPNVNVNELVIKATDNTALTGTTVEIPFPSVAVNTWTTVILPISTLSAGIKSIGVHRTGGLTLRDTITNWRRTIKMDNVRFVNETKLDQALGSATNVAVVVGPNYAYDANQQPYNQGAVPAGKAIIDYSRGVFTGLNKVVYLHDYLSQVSGAETGLVDVSTAISGIINSATFGQIVRATPGAMYRFDQDVIWRCDGVTIDFTGATCFLMGQRNNPFVTLAGTVDTAIIGGTWLGHQAITANASNLVTVAGTPTTSGTTKLIDAQNEEAKIANHAQFTGNAAHYARHIPQQLGLTPDSLGPRNYFTFVLSDSAQVANDCVITLYDDNTSTVLTSTTLTLTATPTAYRVEYVPGDLRTRIRATVKKATATANIITVATYTMYGRNEYNATYDIASAFALSGVRRVMLKDMWIEGFGGDAVQSSDPDVTYVLVDNVTSRACRRQGMSFNQGNDIVIQNCYIAATGRSALDFEPFAADWFTRRILVRNITMADIVNYGFAMANWARNMDYVIDGVDMYGCRLGLIFGGCRRGVFKNLREWDGAAGWQFNGIDLVVEDCRLPGTVVCDAGTNDYNDGTGSVTFTPDGNLIRRIRFTGTGPQNRIALVAGYRLEDIATNQPIEAALVPPSSNPFGPINATIEDYSRLHLGEYARQFPNRFKGQANSPSALWMPGGFNHLDDPVYNARSLSGGTVRGNNLRGIATVVSAGATTLAVTFPARTLLVGVMSAAPTAVGTTGGSLAPSTTYYYRVAPRGLTSGPGTWRAQISAATNASQNAVNVQINSLVDDTNDMVISGISILRGTVSGGPYTQRYDLTPINPLRTFGSYTFVTDFGTTTDASPTFWNVAAQTGSFTAVDESGWEPDANYAVVGIETNWNAGHVWVTGKVQSGFTLNFATAAPGDGSGRVSWMIVR